MDEHFVELSKSNAYSDLTGQLDPEKVFQARARNLLAASKPGIERFAYNLLGPNLLGSIAFALDPYSRFELGTAKITPANRTRKFTTVFPAVRKHHAHVTGTDCIGRLGCPGFAAVPYACTTLNPQSNTTTLTSQAGYSGFASDTTVRTRAITSKHGEFELYVPTLHSSSRTTVSNRDDGYDVLACPYEQYRLTKRTHGDFIGPSAYMLVTSLDAVLATERIDSLAYINKYKLDLIEQALPEHRSFQLSYNIAELKDLPLMLKNSIQLIKGLKQAPLRTLTNRKVLANQLLNEKFGWESTLNAVTDMLSLPEKLAKRINYLLARQGKPTSFRSKKKFLDRISSPPLFLYNTSGVEFSGSTGVSSSREVELRCVVNAIINLPKVDVPRLRQDLLEKLRGQDVTPSDVYNLVPWTWLFDWFSGLGEYISLIDTLNRDPSLINFGFITYVSKGEATTTYKGLSQHTKLYQTFSPFTQVSATIPFYNTHSSTMRWKYEVRKDIGTLSGTKSVTNLPSLSLIQQAIIGALLLKR